MNEGYPQWTCKECALKHGGRYPDGHISCWHLDTCPVCGIHKEVTQPRDYCYPKFPSRVYADQQKETQQEETYSG